MKHADVWSLMEFLKLYLQIQILTTTLSNLETNDKTSLGVVNNSSECTIFAFAVHLRHHLWIINALTYLR